MQPLKSRYIAVLIVSKFRQIVTITFETGEHLSDALIDHLENTIKVDLSELQFIGVDGTTLNTGYKVRLNI